MQYVKLVGSSKPGTTLVPVSALSTKSIPVALPTSLLNSAQTTFKVLPITTQATAGQSQSPVSISFNCNYDLIAILTKCPLLWFKCDYLYFGSKLYTILIIYFFKIY